MTKELKPIKYRGHQITIARYGGTHYVQWAASVDGAPLLGYSVWLKRTALAKAKTHIDLLETQSR